MRFAIGIAIPENFYKIDSKWLLANQGDTKYIRQLYKEYVLAHSKTLYFINPRRAGGGVLLRPPLRFFADREKTAARSAAGFSPTCWCINSANFEKKKFSSSQVR